MVAALASAIRLAGWFVLFYGLIGTTLSPEVSAAESPQTVLVLGRVSDDPRSHYDRLKPLLDYVVPRMADVGIREGRVLMARDAAQMISYLRQGRVDWITETAGAALGLMDASGAELLVRGRRGGLASYHSVVFVRRDSNITDLAGLRGHTLGFQHPMSTSAYLVPAGMLLAEDLPLAIQLSPLDQPLGGFIGYTFTLAESNSVAWVNKRLVAAAAVSNQDWDELVTPFPELRNELKIIARSPDYPRALELVRAGLPEPIRARLLQVLLDAADDPLAAPALASYFGTESFDAIDTEVTDQLDALSLIVRRVRGGIE